MGAVEKSLDELNYEFQDKISKLKLLAQEFQNNNWSFENNKSRFMLKTEHEEKIKQIFDDNWFDLIENAIAEYQLENDCIGMVALSHCLNMSEYIERYLKERLKSKYGVKNEEKDNNIR